MNRLLFLEIVKARRSALVLIVGLILANIGLYVYRSSFLDPKYAALQDKAIGLRRVESGKAPQDMVTVYQQGLSDLAAWDKRIPAKKDFARLIGELLDTARNNSLTMGSISYTPTRVKEERLLCYAIRFNLTGKYANVKSFISDISRFQEIMVIDNIALNNSRMTEEYVDLNLAVTTYFRMEGQ